MKLSQRTALVTGAGSGLGHAIALALAREGADVAVNDIRRDGAERTAAAVQAYGRRSLVLIADVSDSVEVRSMFEQLTEQWGWLDVLVNNAGIATVTEDVKENFSQVAAALLQGQTPSASVGATRTMADSQWRRTLSVHLDGTFYCTREALTIMEPRGSGRIINMASVAGLTGLLGAPDYSAAKAGIIGLTKAVAREVIGRGIYVNAIAPGFIDTPLLGVMDETMKRFMLLQTPMGRLGTAEEIAALALYLASDESSFTVGQVLSPNGGYCM